MNYWYKLSIILCTFGFLKEFRPSEPFIFEFLIGPWRNLSSDEIIRDVFPVNVYSYLSQLVIVFLITDLCRYKPLIILLGSCGIVIWSMLLWTRSKMELQILEGIYGTYMAADIAYYTYMYAKVPKEFYSQVTGHARAAILAGRCLASVISQLLVSFELMDYLELNYITLAAQILATAWAVFLPPVKKSIYFNQELENTTLRNKVNSAFSLMWRHFVLSFSNMYVIKWSIWWAMATCINIQIENYMQPLWSEILKTDDSGIYNGAVIAVSMLLSSLAALYAGSVKTNWELKRDLLLIICSLIIGAVLLLSSQTEYIFVSYGCYVVFSILYHFIITLASSEVSKYILEDTYGLVFGINTFVATALQTVLTLVVVNGNIGLGLPSRDQFVIYGSYFFVLALVYVIISIVSKFTQKRVNDN